MTSVASYPAFCAELQQSRWFSDSRSISFGQKGYELEPNVCQGNSLDHPYLVLFISSRLENAAERAALRETWGVHAQKCNVRVIFALVIPNEYDDFMIDTVRAENDIYGDLLHTSLLIDSHHNQSQLILTFLEWGAVHCQGSKYIGKAEEDVWINMFGLLTVLQALDPFKDMLVGHIRTGLVVNRLPGEFSSLTPEEFPQNMYLPFPDGQLYIFPRAVVRLALKASYRLPVQTRVDYLIVSEIPQHLNMTFAHLPQRSNLSDLQGYPCVGSFLLINAVPAGAKREIYHNTCMTRQNQTCPSAFDMSLQMPRMSMQSSVSGTDQDAEMKMCKRALHNPNVAFRLKLRARCRQSAAADEKLISSEKRSPELFLTHDMKQSVGLGNFLFMVASLLGLAYTSGRIPYLDVVNNSHTPYFTAKFPMLTDLTAEQQAVLLTPDLVVRVAPFHWGKFDRTLGTRLNRIQPHAPISFQLTEYMQSWRYFHHIRPQILRQFTFSRDVYDQALRTIESAIEIHPNATTAIGVHVRRGDILTEESQTYGFTAASDSYLLHLVQNLSITYRPAVVFVVSNDQPYCQGLLEGSFVFSNVVFVDGNSPAADMALLTLMDHLILTVGSFSWWSAYLSDAKDIYYYERWPAERTIMAQGFSRRDYIPPSWKPLGDV
ncbi:putative Galactoside 2-alpha-L-fucosyltransferase 2 [Hypsibius exemplaris]|uniref:L-Fucosyltransferase n=1 Tax=Hypsibius exemplaris TaxID=2072580 RepID=A0A1W0W8L6_HYPEX|nr:putative Galactoside 2-alpha-L-fucosyltransferase 2 [Hypsibius exemplaris]